MTSVFLKRAYDASKVPIGVSLGTCPLRVFSWRTRMARLWNP